MRFPLVVTMLLALLAPPAGAQALRWIMWTNPSTNAEQIWTVDPETGDSIRSLSCAPGAPLYDLGRIRIWRWPIAGGEPYVYAYLDVRGREGLADSIQVPEDAHYFATVLDTTGRNESCASGAIYVGPVTSAPTGRPADAIVELRFFDVHGRLVRKREASGIYFFRARWRSGRISSGKLPPLLR